ncbi:MAG: iron-containing redox enzyme family protein [Polyangiales bacterium]
MPAELNVEKETMRQLTAPLSAEALHGALMQLHHTRLVPDGPGHDWQAELVRGAEWSLREGVFLEEERRAVADWAREAPGTGAAFASWFDALRERGPGQHDPLFDYLAEQASHEEMRWFLRQEVAGEAGFEDLVALTQLRLPARPKLELARNYWDEMGRGKVVGMHGPMLADLARAVGVVCTDLREIVWEALAVGNVLAGLAYNRRFAFHSIGALGAVELTAPTRAVKVVQGLDRLDVEHEASRYFRLHATIDVIHARDWRDEVLVPLIDERPEVARWIAEGALMRLRAGARSYERYRRELGLTRGSIVGRG